MEPLFKRRKDRIVQIKKKEDVIKKAPHDVPENLYRSCPGCQESVLFEDLMHDSYICPHCGFHIKLTAHERIRQLFDEHTFVELDKRMVIKEIVDFPGYQDKLAYLQRTSGLYEGVICGYGKIMSKKVVCGIMDSNFFMGSMGQIIGEKITRCIEYATKKRLPLIIFTTSGGARMQEGILSLVQMAKTSAALTLHKEAGCLYISYITHPTTGGVSASFAMLGDIILAEPKCLIGFAGKRVIASTVNEELPPNFQTSEFMLEKGFIDKIVKRTEARETLRKLIGFHERRIS